LFPLVFIQQCYAIVLKRILFQSSLKNSPSELSTVIWFYPFSPFHFYSQKFLCSSVKMADTTSNALSFDTQHEEIIHDTQWDYYGRYLATCSSDRKVRIFTVGSNQEKPKLEAILTGHEGPIWMISWAHPRFGSVLASCSYDQRSIVWALTGGQWKPNHCISFHKGSVNGVQFAPNEYGLILASASSDGFVAVTQFLNGHWRETAPVSQSPSHPLGAMAVSFAPFHGSRKDAPILASGGCDAKVRLWSKSATGGAWAALAEFAEHKDWVRDVAFNPDASGRFLVVASCSQDKTVIIRRIPVEQDVKDVKSWEVSVNTFPETLWRLSWSPCGTMLLVTTAESNSFILKQSETFAEEWIRFPVDSNVAAPAAAAPAPSS
jgi:protein transport protein SEC13